MIFIIKKHDLNNLKCRPPIPYVSIEGEDVSQELEIVVKPSLADDIRVVGPRYQNKDLSCTWSNYLGTNTSGVLLLGLRKGNALSKKIRENRPTKAYRINGLFGTATDNFYKDGQVVEKSTHWHVKLGHLEHLLSAMQASHQRQMFELCGVDIQSQTAYELAVQGPIRPINSKIPLIYSIKCVQFENPNFTIEIQCVNEYEKYLKTLIHEIGLKLHSTAHCTGIQCIRNSYFSIDNTLIRKYWTLENIVKNMSECDEIINQHENIVYQNSAILN